MKKANQILFLSAFLLTFMITKSINVMQDTEETWKDVVGYEGLYKVSNFGRVISYQRPLPTFKKHYYRRGYASVCLNNKGIQKNVCVHRLVAILFVSNPQNKPEVNHIDGDPSNAHYSNLEWCTHSENIRHADNTGLRNIKGQNSKTSKLTNSQVIEIKMLLRSLPHRIIAKKFKVGKSTIKAINTGQNWSWLDVPKT